MGRFEASLTSVRLGFGVEEDERGLSMKIKNVFL